MDLSSGRLIKRFFYSIVCRPVRLIFDILSTIDMLLIKLRPKTKIISNTNKVLLVI